MPVNECKQFQARMNAEGEHAWSLEEVLSWMNEWTDKYCFQKERGDEGYVHWQCTLSLKKKRRTGALKKSIAASGFRLPNYLEPSPTVCLGEDFYTSKADTRIEGPYTDQDAEKELWIPPQYQIQTLYPYQQQILDSPALLDYRHINCVIDFTGGVGKSTIAAIAELKYNGYDLPPVNSFEKLVATACCILSAKKDKFPGPMFIDIPRALPQRALAEMYAGCEQIKKGKVFDQRYGYKYWWFRSPPIWVFTNTIPPRNYMSADRWIFWRVNDAHELVRFDFSTDIIIPPPGPDVFVPEEFEKE